MSEQKFRALGAGLRRRAPTAVAAHALLATFLVKTCETTHAKALKLLRGQMLGGAGDARVLTSLRRVCPPKPPRPASSGRTRSRAAAFGKLLEGHGADVREYLDVGCSEGQLTVGIGELFGLPPARIHGCDMRDCGGAGFVFTRAVAEKLPYPDGKFQAVSCVMALHHFGDVKKAVAEVRRVLAPGGLLLVREHDCPDADFGRYLDIVHYLYAAVVGREVSADALADEEAFGAERAAKFRTDYRSRAGWAEALEAAGFESLGHNLLTEWGKRDRFRGYHEVFRAVSRPAP